MAVVTYDVSAKQSDVKAKMKAKGYGDSWSSNGVIYNLPNTTLWHSEKSVDDALADIRAVAKDLNVQLQRALAVPHTPWAGITGTPHSV